MQRAMIVLGMLGVILMAVPSETEAEVTVRTDASGDYLSTVIVPGGPPWRPGIWSQRSRFGIRRAGAVLNPRGDRLGDLIPRIVENNVAPHHPWVIWSRHNGRDYDLVWSTWQRSWSRISPVVPGLHVGDDLDPDLAFARSGNPILTWWNRDGEDRGTVYFSIFVANGWTPPFKISTDEFGGRYPTILRRPHGRILITYESDDGTMQTIQALGFSGHPDTITDDIDPQNYFVLRPGTVRFKSRATSAPD